MITEFSVNVDKNQQIPIVNVRGEIDIYTCSELREKLTSTIQSGSSSFILNLENIQYIDSTGLGTIAHTAQTIHQNNGTIFVVCAKPQIKKIFEVSGLERKNITLFDTQDAVLSHISKSEVSS